MTPTTAKTKRKCKFDKAVGNKHETKGGGMKHLALDRRLSRHCIRKKTEILMYMLLT